MQVLLDVARTGSFSAAAAHRNVSQPAISLAVAQLERQAGTPLLVRSRRGVTLTPAGALLARRAEAVEQQLLAADLELRLSGSGIDGPLVVGGTPGVLASLTPSAVRAMNAGGRPLSLRIVEADDLALNEMLRAARIDLALTSVGVEPPPPGLEELEIRAEPFEVVVAPDHALVGPDVDLAELADAPWVLPSADGVYRRQVEALFFAAQVETPGNVVRCDSLATTKAIVQAAGYVTVWPRGVFAEERAAGTLRGVAIRGGSFLRRIGVRRLAGATGSPAAAAFVQALMNA